MSKKVVFFPNSSVWDNNEFYLNLKTSIIKNEVEILEGVGDHLDLNWLFKNKGVVDVLHFHWIQYHYMSNEEWSVKKLLAFSSKLILARLAGYKIVWTVHNLYPHDTKNKLIDFIARKVVLGVSNSVIVMTEKAKGLIREEFGRKKKIFTIPHGRYYFDLQDIDTDQVRDKYELPKDAIVFICFGNIRDYKNIPFIISEFQKVNGGEKKLHLIIAGNPASNAMRNSITNDIDPQSKNKIQCIMKFVEKSELDQLLAVSDIGIFSFRDILNSGSLIEAMSAGLAVVAPNIGSVTELVSDEVGVVFEENRLKEALESIIELDYISLGENAEKQMGKLDWDQIGKSTVKVYNS